MPVTANQIILLNHSDIITPDVIATLRGGDHQAFELLYVTYRQPLRRFAYKLSGSAELADEIV